MSNIRHKPFSFFILWWAERTETPGDCRDRFANRSQLKSGWRRADSIIVVFWLLIGYAVGAVDMGQQNHFRSDQRRS
jgi:hypothetical protein